MKIIILAGGGGTRLYPLSTPEHPKQFLSLIDDKPLLINTIERFLPLCAQKDIVIVTGERYKELTSQYLNKYGCGSVNVVYEPCAKNTAPAILLAVKFCQEVLGAEQNETIFVAPSDHAIRPVDKYLEQIQVLKNETSHSTMVLMGIEPTEPNTGYGYIKTKQEQGSSKTVISFKEKPDQKTAQAYLAEGGYFWNAGMFGFRPRFFDDLLSQADSDIKQFFNLSYTQMLTNFDKVKSISFDYAIAEKAQGLKVVPIGCYWSDIGSWDSLYKFLSKDFNGNAVMGAVTYSNCNNCLMIGNGLSASGENNQVIIKKADIIYKRDLL